MAADGSSVHRLFPINDNCCGTLLWAADDRIVFEANYQLFSVSAHGSKPTKLFGDAPWFILSPNGETAAVDYGCACGHAPDAIAFVNVRGGKPVVVAKPKTMTDTIDGFSPDGTLLVFSRQKFDPNRGRVPPPTLLAVHVGHSTPVTLSHSGLIGATKLPKGATNVQWSPDGNWIAFAGAGGLRVVSTHGGTSRLIAKVPKYSAFSWSPTSKLLAYTTTPGTGASSPSTRRATGASSGPSRRCTTSRTTAGTGRSGRPTARSSASWRCTARAGRRRRRCGWSAPTATDCARSGSRRRRARRRRKTADRRRISGRLEGSHRAPGVTGGASGRPRPLRGLDGDRGTDPPQADSGLADTLRHRAVNDQPRAAQARASTSTGSR